ncbi:MAG TPA: DJ-1/PfpI family protein, partial [Ktedonobacterales bacterium]|nr:DJ-1/PfpI family protein [Ktedonobacterales bacterium]
MKLQIALFEGFDELDALAPYEVLRRAEEAGTDMRVELVTLDPVDEVTAFYGLRIRPNGQLGAADRPDVLIVPGGGWNH